MRLANYKLDAWTTKTNKKAGMRQSGASPIISEIQAPARRALDQRANFLGGSDINILASGDEAKITRLWEEKCGLTEPEDLVYGLARPYGLDDRGSEHCMV